MSDRPISRVVDPRDAGGRAGERESRELPWDQVLTAATRRRQRRVGVAIALSALALGGAACSRVVEERAGGDRVISATGPRISGDPAVSARVEVIPEGTAPFDVAVTALDTTLPADLPTPVETTCSGGGQNVVLTLRSGRRLDYPYCAMPDEMYRLRGELWSHDAAGDGGAGAVNSPYRLNFAKPLTIRTAGAQRLPSADALRTTPMQLAHPVIVRGLRPTSVYTTQDGTGVEQSFDDPAYGQFWFSQFINPSSVKDMSDACIECDRQQSGRVTLSDGAEAVVWVSNGAGPSSITWYHDGQQFLVMGPPETLRRTQALNIAELIVRSY